MGTCRIISHSAEPFRDRMEAGRLLGRELTAMGLEGAVVLGIPRGGVVVAREVAALLDADLDIVLARKLGAPDNPELAIGAIAEEGGLVLDRHLAGRVGADDGYVEEEKARQQQQIERRAARYRQVRPKVALRGRRVVVTDDGVATGATMQAALWAVQREGPEALVVGLPVGPEHTVRRLAEDADEVLCLRAPPLFAAVGQFYGRFEQTTDEELLAILQEEVDRAGRGR